MKKWLALLIGVASSLAFAGTEFKNVPETLQKSLQGNSLKTAQLDNGVLRLQMDKPLVSELVYSTFVYYNICAVQWNHPEQFAQIALKRVELIDAAGAQGFAFDARGDVCVQMGKMGKNFRTFIAQYSVKCDAGTCPQHP